MNFIKNTKDAAVKRIITILGSVLFLYFFAKAIPNSLRKYSLKKQELELEAKRLELEKLRLEVEQQRLSRKSD